MKKGDRVQHPEQGPGTIEALTAFGRARVQFDNAPLLPRVVRRRDLICDSPLFDGAPPSTLSDEEETRRPASLKKADAWQTLEALRLGVVPSKGVKDYSVARDDEFESIDDLLDAGSGCRVIWGDYGAGKTHMLDAAEQSALEAGYATARITLDPTENALHHPLRLYRKIVATVRTADLVGQGYEAILHRLAESEDHYHPKGARASRFFSPYLHALREGDDEDIGWLSDYIRGDNIDAQDVNRVLGKLRWRGSNVLRMSDYRTYGRMYIHLVGTLACWCQDAGTRGLVILFDEVERIDTLRRSEQHYAFDVLRHYAAVTMQAEDLAFDPDGLYKGGHRVHRELPFQFREDQPLSTVFALTPLEEIEDEFSDITFSTKYDIHLPPLKRDFIPELVERIAAIYENAHPDCQISKATIENIRAQVKDHAEEGHDSFRAAVRAAVFLLDAHRLGEPAR